MTREKTKKKDGKTARLPPLRVTPEELETIKARSEQAGLSLSEFVRRASLQSRIVIKESRHDIELIRQLSAIGNNLNQLVRKSHASGRMDTARLDDLLAQIEARLAGLLDDR